MTKKPREMKEVGRLVLTGVPSMTRQQQKDVVAWIRRQASELIKLSPGYSNRMVARIYQ